MPLLGIRWSTSPGFRVGTSRYNKLLWHFRLGLNAGPLLPPIDLSTRNLGCCGVSFTSPPVSRSEMIVDTSNQGPWVSKMAVDLLTSGRWSERQECGWFWSFDLMYIRWFKKGRSTAPENSWSPVIGKSVTDDTSSPLDPDTTENCSRTLLENFARRMNGWMTLPGLFDWSYCPVHYQFCYAGYLSQYQNPEYEPGWKHPSTCQGPTSSMSLSIRLWKVREITHPTWSPNSCYNIISACEVSK
jgi:hypothetical protein